MSSANLTSVDDSASSVELAAANWRRLGLWVFNDSTEILYLGLGITPTTTSFNVKVAAGGFWECPQPACVQVLNGIWANNSSGAARVTEVV
jgi:hypothetical protein